MPQSGKLRTLLSVSLFFLTIWGISSLTENDSLNKGNSNSARPPSQKTASKPDGVLIASSSFKKLSTSAEKGEYLWGATIHNTLPAPQHILVNMQLLDQSGHPVSQESKWFVTPPGSSINLSEKAVAQTDVLDKAWRHKVEILSYSSQPDLAVHKEKSTSAEMPLE